MALTRPVPATAAAPVPTVCIFINIAAVAGARAAACSCYGRLGSHDGAREATGSHALPLPRAVTTAAAAAVQVDLAELASASLSQTLEAC